VRYDLKVPDSDPELIYWIQCSLANRPKDTTQLKKGLAAGTIEWQPGHEQDADSIPKGKPLAADFRTQKPIRHNVNWPPPWEL
jgi:hypothetical protein